MLMFTGKNKFIQETHDAASKQNIPKQTKQPELWNVWVRRTKDIRCHNINPGTIIDTILQRLSTSIT